MTIERLRKLRQLRQEFDEFKTAVSQFSDTAIVQIKVVVGGVEAPKAVNDRIATMVRTNLPSVITSAEAAFNDLENQAYLDNAALINELKNRLDNPL